MNLTRSTRWAFLLVVAQGLAGAADPEKPMTEWVEGRIEAAVEAHDIPSVSVGLVHHGRVFGYASFGTRRGDGGERVDERSLYQIASLSKMFTGIIANELIQEGKLDPGKSIVLYLSSVLTPQANANLADITLEQLLQHRSGIDDDDCSPYARRVDGEPWLDGYSREELVADLNDLQIEDSVDDKEFHYSSCAYAIVGLLCEIVSGKNYERLLREYASTRYVLSDTVVEPDDSQQVALVTPYRKTGRVVAVQPSKMGAATPASALISSIADMTKLQVRQIKAYRKYLSGEAPGALVLTERAYATATEGMRYGTGLMELRTPAGTLYGHDGDADGFASLYLFSPEHELGVVLLTGRGGVWVEALSMEIVGALIADATGNAEVSSD